MAWMVRTAVTVVSLLHISQGAEQPLQDSHRFAMYPGPDDDDDDIKPRPEPDVGEGAVLLWLISSSPGCVVLLQPRQGAAQSRGTSSTGGRQPRDYTSYTSTAHGLGATPVPPPGSGTPLHTHMTQSGGSPQALLYLFSPNFTLPCGICPALGWQL